MRFLFYANGRRSVRVVPLNYLYLLRSPSNMNIYDFQVFLSSLSIFFLSSLELVSGHVVKNFGFFVSFAYCLAVFEHMFICTKQIHNIILKYTESLRWFAVSTAENIIFSEYKLIATLLWKKRNVITLYKLLLIHLITLG